MIFKCYKNLKIIIIILGVACFFVVPIAKANGCNYIPKESKANPQPELTPYEDCGVIEHNQLKLNKNHFDNLSFDEDGLAGVVFVPGKIFLVKKDGTARETHWIDNWADSFHQGLVRVIENRKYGFMDKELTIVIPPNYDFAFPFSNSLAMVCNKCKRVADGEHYKLVGGVWGAIDLKGNIIAPLKYDDANQVMASKEFVDFLKKNASK